LWAEPFTVTYVSIPESPLQNRGPIFVEYIPTRVALEQCLEVTRSYWQLALPQQIDLEEDEIEEIQVDFITNPYLIYDQET
jgi:hypothetical protein